VNSDPSQGQLISLWTRAPITSETAFDTLLPDSDQMTLKGLSDRKIRFNRFLRNDVKCRFDDIHVTLHITYTIFYRKSQALSMRMTRTFFCYNLIDRQGNQNTCACSLKKTPVPPERGHCSQEIRSKRLQVPLILSLVADQIHKAKTHFQWETFRVNVQSPALRF